MKLPFFRSNRPELHWVKVSKVNWSLLGRFTIAQLGNDDPMFVLWDRGSFVLIFDTLKQAQQHAEGLIFK